VPLARFLERINGPAGWSLLPFGGLLALGARVASAEATSPLPALVVVARLGIVVAAIPVAQWSVRHLRSFLVSYFALPDDPELAEAKNQRPQQVLGVVENLVFPWLIFSPGNAGVTAVGAWVGFKAWGNWTGWQTQSNNTDTMQGVDGCTPFSCATLHRSPVHSESLGPWA
jgi:hypothetical protein